MARANTAMVLSRQTGDRRQHFFFFLLPLVSCLRPYRGFRCCSPLPTGDGNFGCQRLRAISMMLESDCEEANHQ
ncbi:hypothetical protein B0H67DRAFT_593143 [Lasiosphaeris hirsuta]|uniref:Uncharacterized protein n=1 Tax=Lasiosphaeris hirsuta TaxID=260670 RepID=A0AA39ZWS4_9PEZI|nr:hypothetical protein B0H67DRAFT_593143 [Lasiosphaeris hirsuta]